MKPYTADEIHFLVKTLATPTELLIFWREIQRCQEHYLKESWNNIIELFEARNKQFIT